MEAPDTVVKIKGAITALLAAGTALFGWVGWLLIIWAACMLVDYITGTLAASSHGEWSSKKAREGLWHKAGEIFAVLVAGLSDIALSVIGSGAVDMGLDMDISFITIITPVVATWYIFTELGSIVENAEKLGANVPPWLVKRIKVLKGATDKVGNAGVEDAEEE